MKNSHEFVHEYMKKPEFVELMRRLGALGDGNHDQSKSLFDFLLHIIRLILTKCEKNITNPANLFSGTLSADEWEAAYLYLSFVLRKVCLLFNLF